MGGKHSELIISSICTHSNVSLLIGDGYLLKHCANIHFLLFSLMSIYVIRSEVKGGTTWFLKGL